ncbi:COP23 domain-containing protein [Oscillatoria sp. HE19RPO]|uniref:COP23 domain-containing protein n=1 Tax=Oscillatoria sp. HE19RPO TaxID=2954806 RepID=UPI0020C47821|nr:COP23 domain-containing protein [Oscillatoria sp. HE19RPO]
MKIKQLATAALGALALCGGMAFESNKAQAQGINFSCVRGSQGGFVTVVSNGRVTRSLITWNSQAFSHSGWTPEARCNAVTNRFNNAFASQSRLTLSTGTINNLGVICGLQGRDRRCSGDNIIITLTPGTNPRGALNQLISATAGGRPLAQSGSVTLNDWADAALNSD